MIIPGELLMDVQDVRKTFHAARPWWTPPTAREVHAVRGATFSLHRGETIGIVGESGSGKTTLARLLVQLINPTGGRIHFKGIDTSTLNADAIRTLVRPFVRMVFQDPDATLNPAYSTGAGLLRALRLHDNTLSDPQRRVKEVLAALGLDESFFRKYPDELSGGEKRRIGICRALLTNPDVIVADEPLSGLDVVLQELVLGLLMREQRRRGFGLILVSHDLDRVNQVCDRVLVMHSGRIVEDTRIIRQDGRANESYRHPYSRMLRGVRIEAKVGRLMTADWAVPLAPSDFGVASDHGCALREQCTLWPAIGSPQRCAVEAPALAPSPGMDPHHLVACHFAGEPASPESTTSWSGIPVP